MTRRDWLMVVLLVTVFAWFGIDYATGQGNDNARAACERGNGGRVAQLRLYNSLVSANRHRIAAGGTQAQVAANRLALREYRNDRRLFVASQQAVATHPGGVVVNCVKAYPDPFPGPG